MFFYSWDMNDSGQPTDLLIHLMTVTRLQVPLVTTSFKLLQIKQHMMIVEYDD